MKRRSRRRDHPNGHQAAAAQTQAATATEASPPRVPTATKANAEAADPAASKEVTRLDECLTRASTATNRGGER